MEKEAVYSQTPLLPFTKVSFRCTRMAERVPKGIPCGDRRKFWQKARESCCNPQTKCWQATPFCSLLWQHFWNQVRSEPGRCKRRYKGCPKWSKGSGPNSNMRVYVVVLVFHTAKQFSGPAGCPAIKLNADTIYMEGALVFTG